MSGGWLLRNIATSWSRTANPVDFVKRLLWTYSYRLPRWRCLSEYQIRFVNPPPTGPITLLVRANGGSDAFIASEVFEHEYYRFDLGYSPATILDLGGNAGFTTLYFSRVYPAARLAVVEPMPDNLRVLQHNVSLNDVAVEIFPAAIDRRDGLATMAVETHDYGHRILRPGEARVGGTLEVQTITVPTIMRQLGWERIGLLKVDIEGHERALFASDCDWLRLVDAMCIECHAGFDETDLRRISNDFGFQPPTPLPGAWLLCRG